MTALAALFAALDAAGVGLDVESARDAAWLAARLAEKSDASHLHPETAPATGAGPAVTSAGAHVTPPGDARRTGATHDAASRRPVVDRVSVQTSSHAMFSRVRLPLAAGLAGGRGVPGALRPLRRKVRSQGAGAIDETATVRRATEDDLWLPVFQYAAERWLELALVVDEAVSMAVWQEVARELRRVFVRAAAFRDVRVWRLATEEAAIGVRRASSRAADGVATLTDRCPFGGGRRGLVLVMTDCVSAGWYDGRVLSLLHRWSRETPVALLQVLPERMWPRTALGEAITVTLRATMTAMTNPHLQWMADLPVPQAGWRSQGAGVPPKLALFPVVTTEPQSLRRLARMVAGISSESMTGVLFDTAAAAPLEGEPAANPSDHVQRFWSVSSSAATELASLLAAAPVQSTGMLRLLRRELLPGSDPGTEAEVLLSGLLTVPRAAEAGDRDLPLEFVPGVRQILLENAPVDRVLEVLRRVAARVTIPGIVPLTFETWIANPSSGAEQLRPGTDPVAERVAAVLEQIGGPYARIVHPDARRGPVVSAPVESATAPDVEPHARHESDVPIGAAIDTDVRRVRIFVSSPGDTMTERALLGDVVGRLNATVAPELNMMLELGSWEASVSQGPTGMTRDPLETADVYIGIVSRRIGATVPLGSRSVTEEEFTRALERFRRVGTPKILYYFDEPPNVGGAEETEQYPRVRRFRDEVSKHGLVRDYAGPDRFRALVEPHLMNVMQDLADADAREPHIEPQMRRAEPFLDRAAALERLRAWWRRENAAPGTLALVGPPGIGKSALAAEWLAELVSQLPRGGIFVASAARPVEEVLAAAVDYFSGGERRGPVDVRALGQILADLLSARGPHLLVFDDFDRMGGEDYGVWIDAIGQIERHPNARILVIGRDNPFREAQTLVLDALEPDAAVALLRARGVTDEPEPALQSVVHRVRGNPAMLALVADAVRDGRLAVRELENLPETSNPRELREWIEGSRSQPGGVADRLDELRNQILGGERDVAVDEAVARAREELRRPGPDADIRRLADLLRMLGNELVNVGRLQEAIDPIGQAAEAWARAGDHEQAARTQWMLGRVSEQLGDLPRAAEAYRATRETYGEIENRHFEAAASADEARVAATRHDIESATALVDRTLALARTLEDRRQLSTVLGSVAEVLSILARLDQAAVVYGQAIEMLADDDAHLKAELLASSAAVRVQMRDLETARSMYSDAIRLFQRVPANREVADTARDLARLLVDLGDVSGAVNAYGVAVENYAAAGETALAARASEDRYVLQKGVPRGDSRTFGLLHTKRDTEWVDWIRADLQPRFEGPVTLESRDVGAFGIGREASHDLDAWLRDHSVIGVMVSDELLQSRFYKTIDMERRIERLRDTTVVPIIVRPCSWRSEKWIAERQVLPGDGSPLSQQTDAKRAVVEVCDQLLRVIEGGSGPTTTI